MKKETSKNYFGFTLIELLVVMLIIAILSGFALPQYQKAVNKARFLQVSLIGDQIAQAQEAYYIANGKYADTAAELDVNVPGGYTAQPFSGNEGVLVWDKFYCHTNRNGTVFCWFKNPSVGFTTNVTVHNKTIPKYRQCIFCRTGTPATISTRENICKSVSNQPIPAEGICPTVDLP